MSSIDIEQLEALKKERADILALPSIPIEAVGRVEELDMLIEDVERDYDTMRVHELSLNSKEIDMEHSLDVEEDDYSDYSYGEISSSFKDPNIDY